MRPMPYMLVDPVEHTHPYGNCLDIYKCPAHLEKMQRKNNPKRLTDAECAAEYWHAAYLESFAVINADLDAGVQFEHEAETWHRFATTPHASEVNYG